MKRLLVVTTFLCFSSIGYAAEEPLTPVVIKDSLRIPDDQISGLKRQANEGDREAAMRLASYYGVYLSDRRKQVHYYRLAAKNGSNVAIQNLATIFSTDPDLFDFEKALLYRQRLKRMPNARDVTVKPDAEWYYDLYIEHFVGYRNKKRGLFFLERAAKHGSAKARDELVDVYSNDPDVANPAKARHWKNRQD